jgi:hypothetical protein
MPGKHQESGRQVGQCTDDERSKHTKPASSALSGAEEGKASPRVSWSALRMYMSGDPLDANMQVRRCAHRPCVPTNASTFS